MKGTQQRVESTENLQKVFVVFIKSNQFFIDVQNLRLVGDRIEHHFLLYQRLQIFSDYLIGAVQLLDVKGGYLEGGLFIAGHTAVYLEGRYDA